MGFVVCLIKILEHRVLYRGLALEGVLGVQPYSKYGSVYNKIFPVLWADL